MIKTGSARSGAANELGDPGGGYGRVVVLPHVDHGPARVAEPMISVGISKLVGV